MSKKRLAASILVILFGILSNILIFQYTMPLKKMAITVEVTLVSNEKNNIQAFYLVDGQSLSDGFKGEQCISRDYSEKDKKQTLYYAIPASTDYFRLDLGDGISKSEIQKVVLCSGKRKYEISNKILQGVIQKNDLKLMKNTNSLETEAIGDDPYLVWNVKDWNIGGFVRETRQVRDTALKILACLACDAILLVILRRGRNLIILPKEILHNRKLLWSLAKNDFKTKYAGSYLGIIWAFVQPIVTVVVYWFVFEKGLKAGGINTRDGIAVPYVLWLVAGLVPWFFFQDALNGGTNAMIEYSYLVKKVVFKISILPIVKIVSSLFVHVFFIAFTLILFSAYRYFPDLYTIQIIYYSLAMFMLILGIVYATCAIVVFFRDLTQIINIVLQIGMWMTPIMWNIDTMELSPVLIMIFKLNPMYYIVAGYRDALINKVWFWENAPLTMYFWILTVTLFGIGTLIFRRLKIHFADVL